MKNNTTCWMLLVALGFIVGAQPCAANTYEADSRIVEVTVFPDRADIVRQARIELSKGAHSVRLAPLPSRIEPSSISARGVGGIPVVLSGVQLVTSQLEAAQDPKAQAIEEEIREVTSRQLQLQNLKRVLEQERAYLNSIQAASSEQIGKELITKSPSVQDASDLLGFLDKSLLENFERDQEADKELKELSQELDKLHRELAQLAQGRSRQETAIVVDLEARRKGNFQLLVSYRVPGVSWMPSYEARANPDTDSVEVAAYGLVKQRTGEDWDDVRLTLSTARPAIVGTMPEIKPWFLKPRQPRPQPMVSKLEKKGLGYEGPYAGSNEKRIPEAPRRLAEAPQEAKVAYATAENRGPSITYELPKPASVASDWQPHKVPIDLASFAADFAYEATPRLSPYAFLRAKVTNTTKSLYLPGSVSIFLDGAFVATARLKQVAPGEEFDLYLGVDERVRVERKRLKEHEEISILPGLRGKMRSVDYEYLTTVENYTGQSITISVFDQYPVSDRKEITVESVRMNPKKIEKDPEKPGVFQWDLELIPTQKAELTLAYRIRYPVDMRIE